MMKPGGRLHFLFVAVITAPSFTCTCAEGQKEDLLTTKHNPDRNIDVTAFRLEEILRANEQEQLFPDVEDLERQLKKEKKDKKSKKSKKSTKKSSESKKETHGIAGCSDIKGWRDTNNYNCGWYESNDFCSDSTMFANMGFDAQSACCFCGGGLQDGRSYGASTAPEGHCTVCEDKPTTWMDSNGLTCAEALHLYGSKCNADQAWRRSKWCEQSCFVVGNSYDDVICCDAIEVTPPPTTTTTLATTTVASTSHPEDSPCSNCHDDPAPWMVRNNMSCEESLDLYTRKCNSNRTWRLNKWCQHSCSAYGDGYDSQKCCESGASPQATTTTTTTTATTTTTTTSPVPKTTPAPTTTTAHKTPSSCHPCGDIPSANMDSKDQSCSSFRVGQYATRCSKYSWKRAKTCQYSCFISGNGYDGDNCCPGHDYSQQSGATTTAPETTTTTTTTSPVPKTTPAPTTTTAHKTPSSCHPCRDVPSANMDSKYQSCSSFRVGQYATMCSKNNWKRAKTCQYSCFISGNGYDGDNCCLEHDYPQQSETTTTAPETTFVGEYPSCNSCEDVPSKAMKNDNTFCEELSAQQLANMCSKGWWKNQKLCQYSCFVSGNGYEEDNCCPEHDYPQQSGTTTTAPETTFVGEHPSCTSCEDIPSKAMKNDNTFCEELSAQQLANRCSKGWWKNQKLCQYSCFVSGNGYEEDNCCPELEPPTATTNPNVSTEGPKHCKGTDGWHDPGGAVFTCDWYSITSGACESYGDDAGEFGQTARTACCACGGGSASYPVSLEPTYPRSECHDIAGWHDSGGKGFNCAWYEESDACTDSGLWSNMGYSAEQACCACGGGDVR